MRRSVDGSIAYAVDRRTKDKTVGEDGKPVHKRKLIYQNTTKTQSGMRTIYLGTKAMTAITELRKHNYRGNDDDYIICTKNYTALYPRNMQRAFDGLLKRAKISHRGLHALRHSFASMLIRNGVEIKVVSELPGHSSVSFTYNQYIHVIDEQKQKAIQKLNDI